MPEGVTLAMVAAVIIPIGVITVALRALPFSFLKFFQGNNLVVLLGRMMPVGVMVVLVIYSLIGQEVPWAALVGVGVTLGLHAWRRNSGLSIIGGTAAYMALVNFL